MAKTYTQCRPHPSVGNTPVALTLEWYVWLPLVVTATVLLVGLLAAGANHFALPDPSPPEAPADEFSEGRAQLLLQLATRSVRTFGSCDNEVAAPVLLHSFLREHLLLLGYPSSSAPAFPADARKTAPVGSDMQAVVGRVSYILLVTHRHRSAARAAAAADAADTATGLRRIQPPGKLTEIETCLCAVQQEQHLLLQQQQRLAVAPAAAAATDLHEVLLHKTQKELSPLCNQQQQQTECATARKRSHLHDFFSPTAAAEAAAAFESKGTPTATATPTVTWEELDCMDSPRLLDPDLPQFVAGTLIPRVQCLKVTRHFLSPPSTVSALIGLAIREHQHRQLQQQQPQPAARMDIPQSDERETEYGAVGGEKETEDDGAQQVLLFAQNISDHERDHYLAVAAAAAAAAEAEGIPVLHHLTRFLLSVDVGLWNGGAGGFAFEYTGTRTAMYAGTRNLTVEIKPAFPILLPSCGNQKTHWAPASGIHQEADGSLPTAEVANVAAADAGACTEFHRNNSDPGNGAPDGLLLAAHFDSAPSSPGISDDLSMCAVALEVARAGIYKHLRAGNTMQLQAWGIEGKKKQPGREEMLQAPLIVNLNGAEEAMLLAAHAFASQHPAARRVKLAVNLEAAGSRGKFFVLQISRPLARRILEEGISAQASPNASAAASDVWNSGQFPGETDFRIWAEVLGLRGGLDLAWIADGANYHTKRDTVENMQPGSLQHTGAALLSLLPSLLGIAATTGSSAATEAQNSHRDAFEIPFYQDVLGKAMLIIPWEAFLPLLVLVSVMLVLSYALQQQVLGVQTSPALLYLSCLTFGLSCIAAAAAACCCSLLSALLLHSHGPLYVFWPTAAAWRVSVAFAALVWCWHKTFFSWLSRRFPPRNHPLLCLHAGRAGPLLVLFSLSIALHRMHLYAGFYVLLLLLGLLGPRLALLLFWYFCPANQTSRSCSDSEVENTNSKPTVFCIGTWRGCALLSADAVGMAVPSIMFFQAYLSFLDGTSGPAGRSGERLLLTDLLLNVAVLLPVLVLLPATVLPPLVHFLTVYLGQERDLIANSGTPTRRSTSASKRRYTLLGAAAALAALLLSGWSSGPAARQVRQQIDRIEVPQGKDATDRGGILPLLLKPIESLLLQHRGFLPTPLQLFLTEWGLTPSESSAFSAERPLQLHFVTFRRSKVTADFLISGSTSTHRRDSRKTISRESSNLEDGDEEKMSLETNTFRFAPDLEPLIRTQSLSQLAMQSTQGVAVLGLGSRAFWNPAEQDTDLVLAAMRNAVLAAEAAGAECTAARPSSTSPGVPEGAATGALSEADNNKRSIVDTNLAAGREGQGEEAAIAQDSRKAGSGAETAESLTSVSPSFQVKEEPPRSDAPLTLAHLHRFSTVRTHWSVYTNAQAFLPPTTPSTVTKVYSPGLRGEVDIRYDKAQDETRLRLLIGGSSLLSIVLPATGLKGWNLEQQAPLQRLKDCNCYMVTISTPTPPVMTKLEFSFHGKFPIRFTTRSAVFDATAPNWGCSQTLLFGFARSAVPLGSATQLHRTNFPPVSGVGHNGKVPASAGRCGGDVFWQALLDSLPPHIVATTSSADAAEWQLPEAPFNATFAF